MSGLTGGPPPGDARPSASRPGTSVRCVAVGLTPAELALLPDTVPVAEHDLTDALGAPATPGAGDDLVAGCDVLVVGSAVPRPVEVVQRVHRAATDVHPVVLLTPETADRVRRDFSYAPGVPLDLTLHLLEAHPSAGSAAALGATVTALLGDAADRSRHRAVVAALSARPPEDDHLQRAANVDLGPLLEHAPVGVVVCEPDGRLRGWNARAAALLGLADADVGAGTTLGDVLPGAAPVLESVHRLTGHAAAVSGPGLTGPDGPEGAEVLVTAPTGRDVEVTAVLSEGDEGRTVVLVLLVDATERRRAERERERLAGHVELLAAVSQGLGRTLDVQEALGQLAEVLVPDFADWATVQLADDAERPGDLSLVAARHRDPAMADVVEAARRRQGQHAAEHAPSRRAARGEPVLLTDLDEQAVAGYVDDLELRRLFMDLGLSSVIAVPLPGRDHILGSMVLVNGPDSPTYTAREVGVAVEVGRRAGLALDNARLYGQQRDLATELQRSLLTEPPQPDHGEIVVRYVPAANEAQVGGDWYDAFMQPDGSTVLVVGDVAGHDRHAAAAMSQVRGVLRGIGYSTGEDPARLLTRTDQALEGLMIPAVATAVVIRLEQTRDDQERGRTWISWSSAGHPPPMLMHPGGHVEPLRPDGGVGDSPTLDAAGRVPAPDMLLGLNPAMERTCWRTCVPRGATVFLYTDGLVERRGEVLDDGLDRLARTLADIGPHTALDDLCDLVVEEMVPGHREDDVALVAIRLHREDGPRPPEAGPERVPANLD